MANISLYWFTGAIGSSFWPYYERMHGARPIPNGAQVTVPVGYAEFLRDVLSSPRARLRRAPSPTSAAGRACEGRPLRGARAARAAGRRHHRVLCRARLTNPRFYRRVRRAFLPIRKWVVCGELPELAKVS